ncbi:MAG: hypothetical protein Q8L48_43080 [Archangium sp.]|nr:hypothetical protein [Archangium sp.]
MNSRAYWLGFLFLLTLVSLTANAFRSSVNVGPGPVHSLATTAHLDPGVEELEDHAPVVVPRHVDRTSRSR